MLFHLLQHWDGESLHELIADDTVLPHTPLRLGILQTPGRFPGGGAFCRRNASCWSCSSTSLALAFSGRCALRCRLSAMGHRDCHPFMPQHGTEATPSLAAGTPGAAACIATFSYGQTIKVKTEATQKSNTNLFDPWWWCCVVVWCGGVVWWCGGGGGFDVRLTDVCVESGHTAAVHPVTKEPTALALYLCTGPSRWPRLLRGRPGRT